ncbi:MAG: TIGR00366 family protein [Flavobacteriaceae bacterium]|nr:TIGR00366 family protein [Flavobacteriaceae bacterium]
MPKNPNKTEKSAIRYIENLFGKWLPSPFTIAVLLTFLTFILAWVFTKPAADNNQGFQLLKFWESGIWNTGLLVFAYQMMLILVLGHVLVLSKPAHQFLQNLSRYGSTTKRAVILVSITTMLVAFFNWGLGLIFGAILTRKIGENAAENQQPINYPLVGAAGYVGLMVWHGGMSGSAPLKIAEPGHLADLVDSINPTLAAVLPNAISTQLTIFSTPNLLVFGLLLCVVPLTLAWLSRKATSTKIPVKPTVFTSKKTASTKGADWLEQTTWASKFFGLLIVLAWWVQYQSDLTQLHLTPNMLNFLMLGCALLLHKNIRDFLKALDEAVRGVSGILIQFPLYFGIMGIMSGSGLVQQFSDFFVSISNAHTLPVYTFFSAGLVNVFVPSGGGQWAIQGPVILDAASQLNVPLPTAVMALAYGDQITNMLQPFWALPLLSITRLKAKEILPYTVVLMLVGTLVYLAGLIFLY